jgi:hypothetical protein
VSADHFPGHPGPVVNAVTAFLGGAILRNVAIDELPPDRHSSFGWVVAGPVTYVLLLILATVAGKAGAAWSRARQLESSASAW